ncbi:M23 family metallopeptidase [Planococcus lenghuensis]|uniref:M23ase beta-sheet core domain-containing protein n=1 Tax=Planococcus lenghuensis TaxID=2213202 RepID=A0A1Q2L4K5_9BACL|nr:M23 family metallopeptidase [Planococcus lenghuensis]AQQ55356.1 hypothetical protein B0X71_19480 [Planococcus lenghuensis]
MAVILRMVLIAFVAVTGMVMNQDLTTRAQTLHYLKEDLEIAVHDAALEVDASEFSNQRIVFDQARAMTTLRTSFEANSRLSSTEYEIVDVQFFDHSTVPAFPVTYTAAGTTFDDVFTGPTVVALIKTSSNAYFTDNSANSYTQVASYSYRENTRAAPIIPGEIIGTPNSQGFVWPVPYTTNVTSPFGYRTHPITGDYTLHTGTDITAAGAENTPIVAAKSGTVIFTGALGSYGNLVVIDHGSGIETRYAHLNAIQTAVGASVSAGQVIGLMGNTGGSTGAHLHFEIRYGGTPYDPMQFY